MSICLYFPVIILKVCIIAINVLLIACPKVAFCSGNIALIIILEEEIFVNQKQADGHLLKVNLENPINIRWIDNGYGLWVITVESYLNQNEWNELSCRENDLCCKEKVSEIYR